MIQAHGSYENRPAEISDDYRLSLAAGSVRMPAMQGTTDGDCYYLNAATCPDCGAGLVRQGFCFTCPVCGFGGCSI